MNCDRSCVCSRTIIGTFFMSQQPRQAIPDPYSVHIYLPMYLSFLSRFSICSSIGSITQLLPTRLVVRVIYCSTFNSATFTRLGLWASLWRVHPVLPHPPLFNLLTYQRSLPRTLLLARKIENVLRMRGLLPRICHSTCSFSTYGRTQSLGPAISL